MQYKKKSDESWYICTMKQQLSLNLYLKNANMKLDFIGASNGKALRKNLYQDATIAILAYLSSAKLDLGVTRTASCYLDIEVEALLLSYKF